MILLLYYCSKIFTKSSAVIPKYFINSIALPDFPNVSFIPILINFVGHSSVKTSEIADPSPPIILWSSIEINFFVSFIF